MKANSPAWVRGGFAQRFPNVSVLAITTDPMRRQVLESALVSPRWKLEFVDSGRDAVLFLGQHRVAVVICDPRLVDGTWNELLDEAGQMRNAPAFIVAPEAEEDPWFEMVTTPEFALLARRFDGGEIRGVVTAAWRHWRRNVKRPARRNAFVLPLWPRPAYS